MAMQPNHWARGPLRTLAALVEPARLVVVAMILDDANTPAVEGGRYFIGYCEMVDGYRHAYAVTSKYGHRTTVRYSRSANHPPDPRCPECHPKPEGES